jgi:long-chain acyl-CoA synthetase
LYPSDLEAELNAHSAVTEAAVIGLPSERWGETPVVIVMLRPEARVDADELRAWADERLGATQRLAALSFAPELPRSAIGKVLKREQCARYAATILPGR